LDEKWWAGGSTIALCASIHHATSFIVIFISGNQKKKLLLLTQEWLRTLFKLPLTMMSLLMVKTENVVFSFVKKKNWEPP
jgi:hypothetical protein